MTDYLRIAYFITAGAVGTVLVAILVPVIGAIASLLIVSAGAIAAGYYAPRSLR